MVPLRLPPSGLRWTGYVTIVLLVGLLGGLAMASIAGARRTQSSFSTLMARSNASQIVGLTGVYNPTIAQSGYSQSLIKKIEHLRYVKDVKSLVDLNLLILNAKGEPILASEGQSMTGSVNGEQFTQDRVLTTNGRGRTPKKVGQFAMDASTAQLFGLHLGQTVTFLAFSNKEIGQFERNLPARGAEEVQTGSSSTGEAREHRSGGPPRPVAGSGRRGKRRRHPLHPGAHQAPPVVLCQHLAERHSTGGRHRAPGPSRQ